MSFESQSFHSSCGGAGHFLAPELPLLLRRSGSLFFTPGILPSAPSGQLRCSRRSCGAVLAQRKVTKRNGTHRARSPGILPSDSAIALRGSQTAHPCADCELARIVRAIPYGDFSFVRSPRPDGTRE